MDVQPLSTTGGPAERADAPPPATRARADRPPKTSTRWKRGLAAAVLVVLAVDVFVRVIEPAITPVNDRGVEGALQKERQIEDLAADGPVEVVFAGTSQTLLGIDPRIVEEASGGDLPAYNAALPGLTPEIQGDWLLDVVVPALEPRLVVIGLSSLDFAADSPRLRDVVDSWQAAPANRQDLVGSLERTLAGLSPIIEHRQALRDPSEWVGATIRRLRGERAEIPNRVETVTDRGLDRVWWDVDYQGDPGTLAWVRNHVIPDFEIGPSAGEALRRTLEELAAREISVVLLDMPVTRDLIEMHPRGIEDVRDADRVVHAAADQAGVPVLDFTSVAWPAELFSDPIHLNGRGATVLGTLLGRGFAEGGDGMLGGGDRTAAGDAAVAAALDAG